jgi:anti-anti-sigma factor
VRSPASGRAVILDMTEVTFLSSMGIRTIVMSAKATKLRGARLVLLSPTEHVAEVLSTTGIDSLVPICDDLEAARRVVGGS